MSVNKTIRLFEAFAGIGSQYKALKNIAESKKWNIEHVGMVEWYIDAIIGYVCIHGNNLKPVKENLFNDSITISNDSKKEINIKALKKLNHSYKSFYINYSHKYFNNLFDIRKVNKNNFVKNIDIFTYSFPCQDLSVQGLQKGMSRNSNTRSGLLWEIERILFEIKNSFDENEMPKYLLMENVTNILGIKNIDSYNEWVNQLDKLGYESITYVLNAKDFNSPQNRTRVFCLSVNKKFKKEIGFEFVDIKPIENNAVLGDIIDKNYDGNFLDLSKYETSDYKVTKNNVINKTIYNYTNFNSENYVYSVLGKGPTLTASGANSRIKIEYDNKIRYMTDYESYLYMGFEYKDYLRVKNSNLLSNNKIIFTAGNSICVQVLEAIFKTLKF